MCDMTCVCTTWLIKKNLWAVYLTATWPFVHARHDLFVYDMTHKCATWVFYVWNVIQSCLRKRTSGQYVSRLLDLLPICIMTCLCVTYLIKRISGQYVSQLLDLLSMYDLTCLWATWLLNVQHESLPYGTWLSYVHTEKNLWAVCLTATWPYIYVWPDLFTYDMTHKKESLGSVSHGYLTFCLCATWLAVCATWLINVRRESFTYESFTYGTIGDHYWSSHWVSNKQHCLSTYGTWLSCVNTETNLWAVCLTATWPLVYLRNDLFACDMIHKKESLGRMSHGYLTFAYVRHDLFMCDMAHKCVTWVFYVLNMAQLCIYGKESLGSMPHGYLTFCLCATWPDYVRHDT